MTSKRRHERSNVRTLVTVLLDNANGGTSPHVFKAWTEDISASGMQFACNEELPPGPLYVRILLPGLEDKIVECTRVRSSRREGTGLLRNSGPRFIYGVKFTRVREYEEFQTEFDAQATQVAAGGFSR